MPDSKNTAGAGKRAAGIRLLCLDVDGTLTDGKLYVYDDSIMRVFSVLDGLGIQHFMAAGGTAALITAAAEGERAIHTRARQIGIRHIYTRVQDKLTVMRAVAAAESVTDDETAYIGDDLPDLTPMRCAGFAAAPPTAVKEVREAAHYISRLPAGGGAVREICEFIIAAGAQHTGS